MVLLREWSLPNYERSCEHAIGTITARSLKPLISWFTLLPIRKQSHHRKGGLQVNSMNILVGMMERGSSIALALLLSCSVDQDCLIVPTSPRGSTEVRDPSHLHTQPTTIY